MASRNQATYLVVSIALAPVLAAVALSVGSTGAGIADLFAVASTDEAQSLRRAVLELRVPRVLGAFAVGGCLGLAGALMQVLVRNPLADPYILGVSGGAALATLLALLIGVSGMALHGAAFAGALGAMVLVFVVAHGRDAWSPVRLLLSGVVLATAWTASISLILSIAPEAQLRGMLFWLMGDLSFVETTRWTWVALCVGSGVALFHARELNLLGQGDLHAAALGATLGRTRMLIYVCASLLAAFAVTTAGSIGFVGLAAPHIARLALGSDHRVMLIGSVFVGGNLLVVADTVARTAAAPTQIPVGVITALVGIPIFLHLLRSNRA
jgi:iron complex transport system permease protein